MAVGNSNLFINYPKVDYSFGNEASSVRFQDLSVYVDVFDQVREYSSYYENYQIQNNERPDHVSYNLYATTDHYWTFFLLNPSLRESGWPLDNFRLFDQAKKYYPYFTVTTTDAVFIRVDNEYISMTTSDQFVPGRYIWLNDTPSNQNLKGLAKIIKVNHNLGQITFEMDNKDKTPILATGNSVFAVPNSSVEEFRKLESLLDSGATGTEFEGLRVKLAVYLSGAANFTTVDGPSTLLPINGSTRPASPLTPEYDAIHHFEDGNGDHVFPSYWAPNTTYEKPYALKWSDVNTFQSESYLERLQQLNEEQRAITVVKPDAILQIVGEFKNLVRRQLDR